MLGVQKNPTTLTKGFINGQVAGIGGLDITAPTPDDEGAWSFPHDDFVDTIVESVSTLNFCNRIIIK